MARADNAYSRFVRLAKVILPLLALVLLSTMFLFSRTLDPEAAIPFADIDVEKIAREQILTNPSFSGVTSDGSEIRVTADSARPDLTDPRRLSAETILGEIITSSGVTYDLRSGGALYDGGADTLSLDRTVKINGSNGYSIETGALIIDLAVTGFRSEGSVTGTASSGRFEAGEMELTTREGAQVLVFKNGVKLVYQPGN